MPISTATITSEGPSPQQCSNREKVITHDGRMGTALWFPQMGGYGGRAVAIVHAIDADDPDNGEMNLLVWHDGEFPFQGFCPHCATDRQPVEIHLCDPEQWVELGKTLLAIARGKQP